MSADCRDEVHCGCFEKTAPQLFSEGYLMCLKAAPQHISSLVSFLTGDGLTALLVTWESLNPISYSFGKPWKYLEFWEYITKTSKCPGTGPIALHCLLQLEDFLSVTPRGQRYERPSSRRLLAIHARLHSPSATARARPFLPAGFKPTLETENSGRSFSVVAPLTKHPHQVRPWSCPCSCCLSLEAFIAFVALNAALSLEYLSRLQSVCSSKAGW